MQSNRFGVTLKKSDIKPATTDPGRLHQVGHRFHAIRNTPDASITKCYNNNNHMPAVVSPTASKHVGNLYEKVVVEGNTENNNQSIIPNQNSAFTSMKKQTLFTEDQGTNKAIARNFLTAQLGRNRTIGQKLILGQTTPNTQRRIIQQHETSLSVHSPVGTPQLNKDLYENSVQTSLHTYSSGTHQNGHGTKGHSMQTYKDTGNPIVGHNFGASSVNRISDTKLNKTFQINLSENKPVTLKLALGSSATTDEINLKSVSLSSNPKHDAVKEIPATESDINITATCENEIPPVAKYIHSKKGSNLLNNNKMNMEEVTVSLHENEAANIQTNEKTTYLTSRDIETFVNVATTVDKKDYNTHNTSVIDKAKAKFEQPKVCNHENEVPYNSGELMDNTKEVNMHITRHKDAVLGTDTQFEGNKEKLTSTNNENDMEAEIEPKDIAVVLDGRMSVGKQVKITVGVTPRKRKETDSVPDKIVENILAKKSAVSLIQEMSEKINYVKENKSILSRGDQLKDSGTDLKAPNNAIVKTEHDRVSLSIASSKPDTFSNKESKVSSLTEKFASNKVQIRTRRNKAITQTRSTVSNKASISSEACVLTENSTKSQSVETDHVSVKNEKQSQEEIVGVDQFNEHFDSGSYEGEISQQVDNSKIKESSESVFKESSKDLRSDLHIIGEKDSFPEFLEELHDETVVEGDTLKLSTSFTPETNQTVEWTFNSQQIKSSLYTKFTVKDGSSALTIRNIVIDQAGEYACEVKNKAGSSRTSCNVKIEQKPTAPVFKKKLPKTMNATEDEKAEFVVTVEGQPDPTVEWTCNGKEITETDRIHLSTLDNKYKLAFDSVTLSDKGRLKCTAKNKAGQMSSSCDFNVNPGPPKLKALTEENQTGNAGDDVTFKLEITPDGVKNKVSWYQDTKAVFRSSKKFEIIADGNIHSFTVKNIEKSDSGLYKCNVTGPFGKTVHKFNLSVKGLEGTSPQIVDQSSEETLAIEGENITLEVKILGLPKPTVKWLKGDDEIQTDNHVTIGTKNDHHTLTINNITLDDDDDYSCITANEYGEDQRIFSVIVQKKIEKPNVLQKLQDVTIDIGCSAEFSAIIKGDDISNYDWRINDVVLEDNTKYQHLVKDENNYTLIIKNCVIEDSGTIVCSVTNDVGVAKSQAKLTVNKPREILPTIKSTTEGSINLDEGRTLTLKAEIHDADVIEWYHNEELLSNGKNIEIKNIGKYHTLYVRKIEASGSGEYTLSCKSYTGHVVKKTFTVEIKAELTKTTKKRKGISTHESSLPSLTSLIPTETSSPLSLPDLFKRKPPARLEIQKGDTLQLEVELSRLGEFDIIWECDGDLITPNENVQIIHDKYIHRLIINNVSVEACYEGFIENENAKEERCHCQVSVVSDKTGQDDIKCKASSVEEMKTRSGDLSLETSTSEITNASPLIAKQTVSKVEPSLTKDNQRMQFRSSGKRTQSVQKMPPAVAKKKTSRVESTLIEDQIQTVETSYVESGGPIEEDAVVVTQEDNDIPFKIIQKLETQVVMVGDEAHFVVILSEHAKSFKWSVNGNTLESSNELFCIKTAHNTYSLTKIECNLEDNKTSVEFTAEKNGHTLSCSAKLSVQPVSPSLVEKADLSQERYAGEDIVLPVLIRGHSNPTVKWFKGFKELSHAPNRTEFTTDGKKIQLVLKNVIIADSGIYKCQVNSDAGKSELKFNVKIKAKKDAGTRPVISSRFQDGLFKHGEEVLLEASITGQPTPSVTWFRNDQPIKASKHFQPSNDKSLHTLTIKEATTADAGEYKIVAKNCIASASFSADISVSEKPSPPVFVEELIDQEIKDTDPVTFQVNVKDCEKVAWYIDDEAISDDEDFTFESKGDVHSFRIKSVNPEDAGKYECRASNKHGNTISSCNLAVIHVSDELDGDENIMVQPVITTDLEEEFIEVTEGEDLTVKFTVTGNPPPLVIFYQDDKELEESEHFVIEHKGEEHILTINILTEDDSGFYLIEAENEAALVEKEFEVIVKPKPKMTTPKQNVVPAPATKPKSTHPPPTVKSKSALKEEKLHTSTKALERSEQETKKVSLVAKAKQMFSEKEVENNENKISSPPPAVKPKSAPPPAAKPKSIKKIIDEEIIEEGKEAVQEELPEIIDEVFESSDKKSNQKPVFTSKLNDVEVVEMSAAKFEVAVAGEPEIEFVWYKDGREIEDSRHYRVEESDYESSLIIMEVNAGDRGRYKCVASNQHGKATSMADLLVEVHGFETGDSESDIGSRSELRTSSIDEDLSDDLLDADDEFEKPQIILPLCDKKSNIGGSAKFSCRAQSITNDVDVTWYVNDVITVPNTRVKQWVDDDGEMFIFSIIDLRLSDSGEYKVVFDSPKTGKLESFAKLDVEDDSTKDTKITVSKSKPSAIVKDESKREPKVSPKPPKAAPKPTAKPAGEKTKTIEAPQFVLKPRDQEICEGMQGRFTASASGEPPPELKWFKNNEEILPTEVIDISTNGTLSTLLTKETRREHEGTYMVVAKNEGGEISAEAELSIIQEKPSKENEKETKVDDFIKPQILTPLSDQIAKEGEDVSFKITYVGKPKPEITWEKNHHAIVSIKRVKVTHSAEGRSELKINGVRQEDVATYSVSVVNEHGYDACSVELIMKKEMESPVICIEDDIAVTTESELNEAPPMMKFENVGDDTVTDSQDEEVSHINTKDLKMKLLEIKELHPVLKREVTRHKFPGRHGIDVVVMPATPRDSPVTGAKPIIHKKPEDLDLNIGETATFELVVEDRTNISVSWTKNKELLLSSGRTKIWQKDDSFFLQISKLGIVDEALYECRVRNDHGEVLCDVQLLVNDESDDDDEDDDDDDDEDDKESDITPKFITTLKKEYIIVEGEELILEVETDGEPPPEVSWFFEDQKLLSSDDINITSTKNTHRLYIQEALLDDEGYYKCVAKNKAGEDVTETEVFVDEKTQNEDQEPLTFVKGLEDCECLLGDEIKLQVEINNAADFKWFLNDIEINSDCQYEVFTDGNWSTLFIKHATKENDGEIKVIANNSIGNIESSCDLFIEVPTEVKNEMSVSVDSHKVGEAPQILSPLANRQVTQGDIVRLDVRIKTDEKPTVEWYCNTELITLTTFPDMTIVSDGDLHSLIITEVKLVDTALYKFVVTNEAGERSCAADLLVMPDIAGLEQGNEVPMNKQDKRLSSGMSRLEEVCSLTSYIVLEDVDVSKNHDILPLKKGDKVEVLDCSRQDLWLVRESSDTKVIGFITPNFLQACSDIEERAEGITRISGGDGIMETILDEHILGMIEEEKDIQKQRSQYVAIGNYDAKFDGEISLSEGMLVELIKGETNQEHWIVRIIKPSGVFGDEGLVPSMHLQLITEEAVKKEDVEESADINHQHRLKVIKEMIQTEEKYVSQLEAVAQSHMLEMEDGVDIPKCMEGKQDIIFSNLREILKFHSGIFFKEMEKSEKCYKSMAECFIRHSSTMENLYVDYCNSRPSADELLNKPEVMEFWDIFQQDTEDPHPLRAYLITPVQRITRYQLLLKELLKYTTRANEDATCMEDALSQVCAIIRLANDTMHVKRIVGYESDLPFERRGKIIRMDSLLCWDGAKGRGKGKERHIFLCENVVIGTKKTDGNKKDDSTYTHKFSIKSSDLGQTEYVDGYPARWVIWRGKSASSAAEQYTLEAKAECEKNNWCSEIRAILAKQLTELKNVASKRHSMPPVQLTGNVENIRPGSKTPDAGSPIKGKFKSKQSKFDNDGISSKADDYVPTLIERIIPKESDGRNEDDLYDLEEEYLTAEYQEIASSPFEKKALEVGKLYRIKEETKAKGSCKTILKQNDLVSLVRPGFALYLVEPAGCEDNSRRTWVPGCYLLSLADDKDEEDEVQDPPIVIQELSSLAVEDGENVVFSCRFVNAEKIEWFYEDLLVTEAEGCEITFKDGVAELSLDNVCISDEGSYSAKALNNVGEMITSCRLSIKVAAKIVESFNSYEVAQYENVSFKVEFKGHPPPEAKWYHNDKEVVDQGKFIIETNQTLSILDIAEADLEDSGEYTCFVKNTCGEDSCAAILTVKGDKLEPPGAPSATKVTDKSVTLNWKDSSSIDVNYYIVERRNVDDSAEAWKVANERVKGNTCIIDGLKGGEEIFFRVRAANENAKSEPSSSHKVLVEAPRRKKTKKKNAKSGGESFSEDEELGDVNLLSPTQKSKSLPGRLSPFSNLRNRRKGGNSSSDEDLAKEKGKSPRARSKSPSSLNSTARKGRSRSKSPMRQSKSPVVVDMENGEIGVGPPVFTKDLENCFVVEGGAARFTCRVGGNPEPEVTWFKDNDKIKEGRQFTMLCDADENCVLIITKSDHDTAGSYTCVASNSEGTVKSSAILFVEGLQTEYDSETEEEVSDPEPLPEKESVEIRREDVESYYVLKEELGRGKFGVVTKCIDKSSNVEYAAKFIKCRPSDRKNVANEIDIMNSLNHKRLINLVAAFESSRQIVLILELVTGGELFEKLTEEEYISEKDVTFYMKQVLQAVQHMHEREVLHLDLKPENIMLVNQRSTQIKLIDFGLARRYKTGDSLKVLFGTPEFMAPEVINYDQVSPTTDMWSIGVITYVLLSGLSPFAGDDDSETLTNVTSGEWDFDDPVFEDISDEAKDFISELLVMKQKDRASVKDCLDHPWFMFKKFKKKIRTDRLKAFTARRKWKKAITAVRSTNFLTRLLTGIKASTADSKPEEKKPSSSNTGPAWKKADDVANEDDLAPEFQEKLKDLKVAKGEVVHFQAKFVKQDGEDPPIVTWKKEGKEIIENKRIHSSLIDEVIRFKILNSNLGDTGRYTARLETNHGSTECSAQLVVRDIPGPPSSPTVPQVLATSALVQWRPGFDGNSPIISYQLQYRKLGDKEWSLFADEIKETLIVVEDLESNSSYRFRVSAKNEVGVGEMSESTGLIETTEPKEEDHRSSIDAPGARRLSRSSSIRVPTEIKIKVITNDIKLREENPESYYNFKEEIGRGKFAVVKKCASKITGDTYAAKMVKFDEDTIEITNKEYEIWKDFSHENLVSLHEAFLVRKYLILICDLVTGDPVLYYLASLETPTEDDVARIIRQLLVALDYLHQMDLCHLDVKPGNMIMRGESLKLIDYGTCRKVITKGGEVGEMVGTVEFMAPEMIMFEPVSSQTDIWSVGVVTYALLSGISPFAAGDEDETCASITSLDYRFEASAFSTMTEEAKAFIKSLIIRIPEKRPTADISIEDPWVNDCCSDVRCESILNPEALLDLAEVLADQENLESVHASLVLRTFLQSPYDSPESETDNEDEDENETGA